MSESSRPDPRDESGPQRGFFDLWSRFYDWPPVQRLTYRPVQDAVVDELRAQGPARVLDIGCGTGLLTSRLARRFASCRIVGCDFSPGMLRQASRRRAHVGWVRGNAMALPFADGSFDTVISTDSFHWFPDQRVASAEGFRVLAPKGRLLIGVVNPPVEWLSEFTRVGSRILGEPLFWPTLPQLRATLRDARHQRCVHARR